MKNMCNLTSIQRNINQCKIEILFLPVNLRNPTLVRTGGHGQSHALLEGAYCQETIGSTYQNPEKYIYYFAGAAVTKYHKLGGLIKARGIWFFLQF